VIVTSAVLQYIIGSSVATCTVWLCVHGHGSILAAHGHCFLYKGQNWPPLEMYVSPLNSTRTELHYCGKNIKSLRKSISARAIFCVQICQRV
jgi:hypothetical protein